jgi:hypothetical protein
MNTASSAAGLEAAWRDLAAAWQHVSDSWRDAKAKEFEERFVTPLPGLLTSARAAMEDIDTLLRKLHHDCE